MLHYEDEWKKLNDLISYCEVYVESFLQYWLLNYAIVYKDLSLDKGSMISSTQLQAVATTALSLVFGLSKPFIKDNNDSLMKKVEKIVWILFLWHMLLSSCMILLSAEVQFLF